MSFVTRFINQPGKALLNRALAPFGYTIQPLNTVAMTGWMGLPNRPIRTVLDIGALYGKLSELTLAPLFPDAKFHCFEPSPAAFAQLKERAKASGGRITAHHMGLGDVEERMMFNASVDAPATSSILPASDRSIELFPQIERTTEVEVQINRLDDIAPSLGIEDDLLIKIDVQGFEDRVLRGGPGTIARAVACIIEVQVVELYEGQPLFQDIFRIMDGLGFSFEGCLEQYFGKDGEMLYFDAVFVKRP